MKKLSRRSVMEAVRREGAAVVTNHHPPQLPELARLQADDVLPLDQDAMDGVEICVGDRVVARGELVDHGGEGRLGVRILGPVEP